MAIENYGGRIDAIGSAGYPRIEERGSGRCG